jgi:hypothetical protein
MAGPQTAHIDIGSKEARVMHSGGGRVTHKARMRSAGLRRGAVPFLLITVGPDPRI